MCKLCKYLKVKMKRPKELNLFYGMGTWGQIASKRVGPVGWSRVPHRSQPLLLAWGSPPGLEFSGHGRVIARCAEWASQSVIYPEFFLLFACWNSCWPTASAWEENPTPQTAIATILPDELCSSPGPLLVSLVTALRPVTSVNPGKCASSRGSESTEFPARGPMESSSSPSIHPVTPSPHVHPRALVPPSFLSHGSSNTT